METRASVRSPIRAPRDFWAGVLYVVIGLSAIVLARDYGMGTAMKMGPGYFPTMLGSILVLIGGISLVRSLLVTGEPVGGFAFKPLALIVGSTLLCGFLLRPAGMLIALPLLVLASAWASARFSWVTAVALAVGVTGFCVLVFSYGLGLPIPLLGPWFGH